MGARERFCKIVSEVMVNEQADQPAIDFVEDTFHASSAVVIFEVL